MTENANNKDLSYFDATPYLKLIVDKEGRWFQNGVEIIHPRVQKQFLEALEKNLKVDTESESGGKYVRLKLRTRLL